MSEPRDDAPPRMDGPVGTEGGLPLADVPSPNGPVDLEPDDDAPTIISHGRQRQLRPEESFVGALRGRRLAHFELIEPVGVGGMAAVIQARDLQLDRAVALKILPPEMAADPENIRRFQQEARAAARLDHENIARAYYCGEDQGLHFIAFEYVEGENLRAVLDRRGRLPVAEAVPYLLQIAMGLAHAAERGVVHRDVKPSNIIITPTGKAKLVDMGLARSVLPQGDDGLTQSGVTLGTFDYISPEQALEPRSADVRSDLYSLGCTFYQVLTGQPPVPEGTAAKKLHHHQHVPPIDPRLLNPEIPDELALILSRMMAKNPRDRYQKPEHLVEQLRPLVQRYVGSAAPFTAASPGGAFAPSAAPMWSLAVGTGLVTLMLILLATHEAAPPSDEPFARPFARRPPSTSSDLATPKDANVSTSLKPPSPNPTPGPERARVEARTGRDLAAFFERKFTVGEVFLVQDLDLTTEEQSSDHPRVPGLIVQGTHREVVIQPLDSRQRVKIRLTYNPDLRDAEVDGIPAWTALTIRGAKVTLRNLRFELDATQAPRLAMAAVQLLEGGTLRLENCEFVQMNPPNSPMGRMASIVVEDGRSLVGKASLSLSACSFVALGGDAPNAVASQEAIALAGPTTLQAGHCAFGPHPVMVQFRGRKDQPASEASFHNCSYLVSDGAVFQIKDGLSCRLIAQHCLFSRPESPTQPGVAVLVEQSGTTFGSIHFNGRGNRYHNLGAFWTRPEDGVIVAETFEGFQKELALNRDRDEQSLPLAVSPWIEKSPVKLLDKGQPHLAFQIDARQPDLRQVDQPTTRLVGVQRCAWGTLYEGKLPTFDERTPDVLTRKVVDPSARGNIDGKTTFDRLSLAVLSARQGDTILIKHTGLLPVEPIRLDKGGCDIVIKPFPGYRPVLTLGDTSEPEAAIFRVHDNRLTLERLEFHLKPRQRDFRSQAVVWIAGSAQCQFKNCVLTLEPDGAGGVNLSAVALADPKDVMKMDPPPGREFPELTFEGCFVRGTGDLVEVRASRPFDLRADNCLVALEGAFLAVEGNSRDPAQTPAAQLALNRITTHLAGHLIVFRAARSVKEFVPLYVRQASDCLFYSADGQPLVHVQGDADDAALRKLLNWIGERNAYGNFKVLLDQTPRSDEIPMTPLDVDRWEEFSKERDSVHDKLRFVTPPPDRAFAKALPSQFRVRWDGFEGDSPFGAIVTRLPRPRIEGRPPRSRAAE